MNNHYEHTIRASARELQPGQKTRTVCPFCAAMHEKSFDIKRDLHQPHKIWCKCFRGTCGKQALVIDKAGVSMVITGGGVAERPLPKPLVAHRPMPPSFLSYLTDTYDIPASGWKGQGCRYEPEQRTLCMPWLDVSQEQKGWVEKRFKSVNGHKSHHDLCNREKSSRLAFPRVPLSYKALPDSAIVVLVEDLISAYKILEFRPEQNIFPVALLGAQISIVDAALLGRITTRVVVLLDHDQWPKGSLRLLNRIQPYVLEVRATSLDRDPKDCPPGRLAAFLQSLEETF